MQRAKTNLTFSVLATLLAHNSFAVAQAPIPSSPIVAASLTAPSAPDSKQAGPVGAAAKALSIGRADESSALAGSLKELENLQREAFLGDLRAKIRGQIASSRGENQTAIAGASPPATLTQAVPTVRPQVVRTAFTPPKMAPSSFPIFPLSTGSSEFSGAPTAQFVSVIVSAARTRADVMEDGIVKTVKNGDKLGDWSVTSITTNGVMVERTAPFTQQVHQPVVVFKANGSIKAAPPTPIQFIAPAVPYERVTSVMLKPYRAPVATTLPEPGQAGIVAPVIPRLPASIKVADSTSIAPPVPLTAAK